VLLPLNLTTYDPNKGLIWHSDGRVRSTWNAHVTAPGRLSSSGPNLQNIGSRKGQGKLKTLFAAEPGHLLVGADLDQAHLRIIANYWKIPTLIEGFVEGKDPHNALALALFGDKFKNADGWGPDGFSIQRKPGSGMAKAMRDISKTFRYAAAYAADPATIWQVLTSTESDSGELPYLGMTTKEVRHFHETWLKTEPEWLTAWDAMQAIYKHQGFMEEPVMGRRSGLLSDGKKQEVVNFPILAAEASCMRLAEQALVHAFPWDLGRRTGLIHQCHDSVAVEVDAPPGLAGWKPAKGEALPPELEKLRKQVEECMTVRIPGWDVPLTAEASVGRNLKEA
jgi:DNA polymerase-1